LTLDVIALNKRKECPVGEVSRGSPRETSVSYIGLEPDLIPHKPLRLITEHPHLVQEAMGKPDLHAFGLDPVVQDRQEIGDGLIRPVGSWIKPEQALCLFILLRLLYQVAHVFLQQSNLMTGQPHDRLCLARSPLSAEAIGLASLAKEKQALRCSMPQPNRHYPVRSTDAWQRAADLVGQQGEGDQELPA
jgi:hypothetical protein